jgi:hypothetical protein
MANLSIYCIPATTSFQFVVSAQNGLLPLPGFVISPGNPAGGAYDCTLVFSLQIFLDNGEDSFYYSQTQNASCTFSNNNTQGITVFLSSAALNKIVNNLSPSGRFSLLATDALGGKCIICTGTYSTLFTA